MKEHIKVYMDKLEESIIKFMDNPVSQRNAEAVDSMVQCWQRLDNVLTSWKSHDGTEMLTQEAVEEWAHNLSNDDGTVGAYWTMVQTTDVGNNLGVDFEDIEKYEWYITMNMLFSDYGAVATAYGVNNPQFFGELAKSFLYDDDGGEPSEKLCGYYKAIVEPNM